MCQSVTGCHAYLATATCVIVKVAVQGERPGMDSDCLNGLKRLIQKCWHQDPPQRPSCAETVKLTDIMMQQKKRARQLHVQTA